MGKIDKPVYTNPEMQRGLGLQLLIAVLFGYFSLLLFNLTRRRWPEMFAARTTANRKLPPLRNSLFGWIYDVYKISNRDVLKHAGLDTYVFLMFFEASVSLLWKMTLCYYFIIAPLRWWYLGQFDEPDDENNVGSIAKYMTTSLFGPNVDSLTDIQHSSRVIGSPSPNLFGLYIWVYVAATYVFTAICLYTIRKYSYKVVDVRQAYLGHQNSITDRTLRISGIPRRLRSKSALGKYLTILFGVAPEKITLCPGKTSVDALWKQRTKIRNELEKLYADYIGIGGPKLFDEILSGSLDAQDSEVYTDNPPSLIDDESADMESVWARPNSASVRSTLHRVFPGRVRPRGVPTSNKQFWSSSTEYSAINTDVAPSEEVDLIDYYTDLLADVDQKLTEARESSQHGTPLSMAFITTESVTQCQLAAQAKVSPLPHTLVTSLAPSPRDIVWPNVYLNPKQRSVYNYVITVTVIVVNAFLAVPLTYLARFLDLEIISKHFPNLGKILSERHWLAAFVTDVLPTYVFASFNLFVPYVFSWLSKRQGFVSRSEIELSTINKNFFYVFVNLFLIFTIESTLFSFSVDKFAKRFAHWLIRLSSFYTNLIVLQGIGIAPSKLLQLGDVFQFPWISARCKTARDRYMLLKPTRMNFGLVLPNSMFILIVVLSYSTLRGRILLFGLIYFAVSYIVYKYQLLYTMVHPQHSNAKLWITIVRRIYLGLGVFHLAVIGVLVLQSAYILSMFVLPATVLLLGFWYDFEKFTKPLLEFVAIEALYQSEIDISGLTTNQRHLSNSFPENEGSVLARARGEGILHTVGEIAGEALNADDPFDQDEEGGLAEGLWDSSSQRDETIDEFREKGAVYENAAWSAPLDGPWIATKKFQCIVANKDKLDIRDIPVNEWI